MAICFVILYKRLDRWYNIVDKVWMNVKRYIKTEFKIKVNPIIDEENREY